MNDIRRTLLWVVFTLSLLMLWDSWQRHHGQPSFLGMPARPTASAHGSDASGQPVVQPTAQANQNAAVPAPSAALTPAQAGVLASATPASAATPELTTITTDVVRATFSSQGGELQKLELLQYQDSQNSAQNVVLFDRSAQRVYLAQTGLITQQPGVVLPNHFTHMQVMPGDRSLKEGQDTLQVRFETAQDSAVQWVKTYTFKRGQYTVGVNHEVINHTDQVLQPQLYLQLVRDGNPPPGESSFYFTFTGPGMYTDAKKFQKLDFSAIEKGKADHEKSAQDGWIAMIQHYFASAWIVPAAQKREFRTTKVSENLYAIASVFALGDVAPGAHVAHESVLFAGPQEENKLAALAPGLELVKDYGWFTMLAKPLFWLLDKLYEYLGNWGWAIVALVFLLKAAFFTLNASAYRSMAKMKTVTPRIMEMRERLKDNPRQMQQEMMRIYREEKVNPLGGCLPMIVQMPFFIALYWVLLSSVEMRNAPWVGWITDLSAKDPYFILPLLMTLSTLLQTWLNPTPPDPMQAKLMWIMPLAFSFMFFFFPAGLVLYWFTNNVLSIAQHWAINKRMGVLKTS